MLQITTFQGEDSQFRAVKIKYTEIIYIMRLAFHPGPRLLITRRRRNKDKHKKETWSSWSFLDQPLAQWLAKWFSGAEEMLPGH